MKTFLFVLLTALLFSACSKNSDSITNPVPESSPISGYWVSVNNGNNVIDLQTPNVISVYNDTALVGRYSYGKVDNDHNQVYTVHITNSSNVVDISPYDKTYWYIDFSSAPMEIQGFSGKYVVLK